MEYFTRSHPVLISDKLSSTLEHTIEEIKKNNPSISHNFYENIILPNKGVFIVLLIIAILLLYRYFKRQENFETDTPNPDYANYTNFSGMDLPNERIARPTFNPSYPVAEQTSYVNYLPDHVPVNVGGLWKNNVQNQSYVAPPLHDECQYSGPYYRGTSTIVSDDGYQEFAQANATNLDQFDELLRQNTRDTLIRENMNLPAPFA